MLGLGAGTRALAEGFHDIPFERPAGRLRDAVTQVRALLAGEPGRTARRARRAPTAAERATHHRGPHLGRGTGPAHHAGGRRTRRRLDPRTGGPGPPRVLVGAAQRTAAAHHGDRAHHRRRREPGRGARHRRRVYGLVPVRHGRCLRPLRVRPGLRPEVEAIIVANPRPSPRRATVPEAAQGLLDQLAVYGTGDEVRERLKPWERTADIVTVLLPPGLPWPAIESTLRAAAP